MTRRQVGRSLAGSILAAAFFGASSAFAAGALPVNTALPSIGRADHQDKFALDVGQPVVASAGTWTGAVAYSYRFSRCPTPALDASCTALGGWQPDSQATYDPTSAGQYGVVEVEATDAAGTSAPAVSPAKLLTTPPVLNAAGIHLTGGLPDGSVAAGSPVDVRFDPTAIAGVPTPTVIISWDVSPAAAGSDVVAIRTIPYAGPLAAPATMPGDNTGIVATVSLVSPGGVATARSPGLYVRSAPFMTNSCLCFLDPSAPPPLRPAVGDRIPIRALGLGKRLGLPAIIAGVPTPRVTMQWLRCRRGHCSAIHHATKAFYVVARRDVGYSLRVHLTAANALGSYSLDLLTPGHRAVRAR